MPDADKNFGGFLGLDFRKWWRHVQAKNDVSHLANFFRYILKILRRGRQPEVSHFHF